MSTDTPTRERTLPSNLEAERTVLGAVLVDNAAFNSAAEILSREDFHRDPHRRIYEAMTSLAERSQPIDLVTLKDELTRRSALEAVGGAAFLAGLVDDPTVPGGDMASVWVDELLHVLPSIPGYASTGCWGVNAHGVAAGDAILAGNQWWWQGSRAFIAEPGDGDFDGDGLKDVWELQGYTHDNGQFVDLPAMGANPLRKDLFVEIDYMVGNGYDHRPLDAALQKVVEAFAARGIALHVAVDEALPWQESLGTGSGSSYDWAEFDAI